MITWGQIVIVMMAILLCATTVAICDITIIKEIKKLRKTIKKFSALLVAEEENEKD